MRKISSLFQLTASFTTWPATSIIMPVAMLLLSHHTIPSVVFGTRHLPRTFFFLLGLHAPLLPSFSPLYLLNAFLPLSFSHNCMSSAAIQRLDHGLPTFHKLRTAAVCFSPLRRLPEACSLSRTSILPNHPRLNGGISRSSVQHFGTFCRQAKPFKLPQHSLHWHCRLIH